MISLVRAPNPGPYTGPGTNTYVLASGGEALVLDPGPVIDSHELAIVDALDGAVPVGVVVTHTHPDHAPMANPLATRLGVPVYGYEQGPSFVPDVRIGDGARVTFGDRTLTAVHTPGHTRDHLCFLDGDTLFTGDHIMGGSTVIIEDAAAYLDSLYRVRDLGAARIEPGHGEAMDDAGAAIGHYIEHRLARERQIIAAVVGGASTVGEVVDAVYAEVPPGLRPAAVHQVRVQLAKLSGDGAVGFVDDRTEHSKVRPESG
jgi:glyoxylase-like metal-dependent hydrolase (beta-lactamase superfamily II)